MLDRYRTVKLFCLKQLPAEAEDDADENCEIEQKH